MSHNSCTYSNLDCLSVLSCVNSDLLRVRNGTSTSLTNFCDAVAECVDAQFALVAAGLSNQLDNFGSAMFKTLQSLSGYSDSTDVYLYSTAGTLGWSSVAGGQTYVTSGTGITVTGNGSFSNQYTPTLNTTYVKNLFSATNGLTYTSGNIKLGGTLIENTVVTGASTYNFSITAVDDFVLESLGDTYLKIASYSGSSSGDVLTLLNTTTAKVGWRTPSSVSGQFIENQYATDQNASFRINGYGFVGLRFTAGSANQITDTSHYFKGVASDIYQLVVHNSSGTEVFSVNSNYLKIPTSSAAPTPQFTSPFHEGSIYYNSTTANFAVYTGGVWTNVVYDTRLVSGQYSITGGGALNADLTFRFVNDVIAPGNSKYYGTDGTGVKGWYSLSSGSVSSVDVTVPSIFTATGGPITSSGIIDITLNSAGANRFFMGPSTGVLGIPAFRAMVSADLPAQVVTFGKIQNVTTSRLIGRSSAGSGAVEELSLGSNLSLVGGVLNSYGRTLTNISRFTSSGTWVMSPGTNAILVYTVAAGGGGGAVSWSGGYVAAASGGGAGAFSINYLSSGFGTSQIVTVGVGGTGAAAGDNDGADGGNSSFGSLIVAEGGKGGEGAAYSAFTSVREGGAAGVVTTTSGAQLGFGGSPGGPGFTSNNLSVGGQGGSSLFANDTAAKVTANDGDSAGVYGGGGGAGLITGTATGPSAGGNGADGIVIIYEFS